jgi:ring-1,2-phenylacetyl-CoA epoxidase subunit PaaE
VQELFDCFCSGDTVDEAWICGPESMIETVADALLEKGLEADALHAERFGAPGKGSRTAAPVIEVGADSVAVTVIMDGHKKSDAAAEHGLELPYSCKGGVCATCRTYVREGKVDMATNYGLEPWEVEKGFVLACQSTPLTDEIVLDYDKS